MLVEELYTVSHKSNVNSIVRKQDGAAILLTHHRKQRNDMHYLLIIFTLVCIGTLYESFYPATWKKTNDSKLSARYLSARDNKGITHYE